MRHVALDAIIHSVDATGVFDDVTRFERYPGLTPHVRSAVVHAGRSATTGRSSWELHFRSGLLRWTEQERFVRDELFIEFAQEVGDFDSFSGNWRLRQDGAHCALSFRADFDFGIPSLEGILDPIAERVIKETVAWAVTGMFDKVDIAGTDDMTDMTDMIRPWSGTAAADAGND